MKVLPDTSFQRGDYILSISQGGIRENLHRLIRVDNLEKPRRYWEVTSPGRDKDDCKTYVVVSPERVIRLTQAQVKTILAR